MRLWFYLQKKWFSRFRREKTLTRRTPSTQREKNLDFLGFSFVTVVSFVFKESYPVKNGRAKKIKPKTESSCQIQR